MIRNDRAEIGISSLVLFMATITVSGAVTVVMLDATDTIMTESDGTLNDILDSMYPSMKLVSGYAVCNGSTVEALVLKMTVGMAVDSVNLSGLFIETFDGDVDCNLSNEQYALTFIRNTNNSDTTLLESGDLISIRIDLVQSGQVLMPGDMLDIVFYPVDSGIFAFSYTAPNVIDATLVPLSI